MSQLSFVVGGILVVIGAGGYVASNYVSPTALIPAAIGLVIVVLGALAQNEKMRKHAMHAAMAVALIGIFGTITGLISALGAVSNNTLGSLGLAPLSKALTATALIGYLALGVRSFVQARRSDERRDGADRRVGPDDRRDGDDRRFTS